jgi:hypothetical protein
MLPGVPKEFIVTVKDSRCRTLVQTVCRIYIVFPEKKISRLKSDMRFMLQTKHCSQVVSYPALYFGCYGIKYLPWICQFSLWFSLVQGKCWDSVLKCAKPYRSLLFNLCSWRVLLTNIINCYVTKINKFEAKKKHASLLANAKKQVTCHTSVLGSCFNQCFVENI